MSQFTALTRFLPIITRGDFATWIVHPEQLPLVNYGVEYCRLRDAIENLPEQHQEMDLYNYQGILEEQGIQATALRTVDVRQLDARTVMAMLVAVYRGERFCDGLIMSFLEEGCIQRWLERLQELDGEEQ